LLDFTGFTLIEIMAVVAVIAILVAMAVPSYQRMVRRGNQQGAIVALTSVYMAEKSFAAQNATYTTCLHDIGLTQPAGIVFYTTGFNGANIAANCGPAGGQPCNVSKWDEAAVVATCAVNIPDSDYWSANQVNYCPSGSCVATPDSTTLGTLASDMSNVSFTCRAVGNIADQPTYDSWYIDHTGTTFNSFQSY
jgi:prepilin-type N-terminal cleavage/methylation domain-containing protein